jgi:hypothetical protein
MLEDIMNLPIPNSSTNELNRMRERLDTYDNLLDEIENFQVETDHLV